MLKFCQDGRWRQDSLVQSTEKVDLTYEKQVVERRGVCDNNHSQNPFRVAVLSP
jgi:hypothetical protein